MDSKKLVKRLTYLILFIFSAHFLANKFYWYVSIWWFDMPMHFFGGFWIGLAALYFFGYKKEDSINFILKILLSVLIVGIGWEVYEILVNTLMAENLFNYLDTISDISFDLSGGLFAILYFLRRIIFNEENKVHPIVEL